MDQLHIYPDLVLVHFTAGLLAWVTFAVMNSLYIKTEAERAGLQSLMIPGSHRNRPPSVQWCHKVLRYWPRTLEPAEK